MTVKKANDFKDKSKIGVITAVDPQKKTVDISYVSQAGSYKTLNLPYAIVGLTWGFVFMPVKGDKVVLDNAEGDRPVIVSMHPNNIDYLPYLDPGEIAMLCENGSYVFGRNKRKKIKSTGALIDYDATKGPNGETDIEYEPGGLILRARSKQNRDGVQPSWYNHSFLALFDNGDTTIQSMYQSIPKALLFMEGTSGFTFWSSGNGKVQEYIELNPVSKELVLFSDGDKHSHVQVNSKESVYSNIIKQIGGGLQINLGVDIATIPVDFDKILPTNVGPGDIYIDNTTTTGAGSATFHFLSDFNILDDTGNFNVTFTQGDMTLLAPGGNITMTSGSGDSGDSGDASLALPHAMGNSVGGSMGKILHTASTDISHIAPSIGLGKLASELDATEAIINKTHLSNFGDILNTQRLNDMIKMASTLASANVPNAGNAMALLSAMGIAGIGKIGIPEGSSIVKAIT